MVDFNPFSTGGASFSRHHSRLGIEALSSYKLTESKIRNFLTEGNATYAIAKFNGAFLGAFQSGLFGGGATCTSPHAEDHAIHALKEAAGRTHGGGTIPGNFTIKVSKSPCERCTTRILELKQENPELRIRIKVLGLYTGESVKTGLDSVNRLQGAGIPVRLWDVYAAFESDELSGHSWLKGRELKLAKPQDFAQIGDKRSRKETISEYGTTYVVQWSDKRAYSSAFADGGPSEDELSDTRIQILRHSLDRVGAALAGQQRIRATKNGELQGWERLILSKRPFEESLWPRETDGSFTPNSSGNHYAERAKPKHRDLLIEVAQVDQTIIGLQTELSQYQRLLDQELNGRRQREALMNTGTRVEMDLE